MSQATPQSYRESRNEDVIFDYNNLSIFCPVNFQGGTLLTPPSTTPFGPNISPFNTITQQVQVLNNSATTIVPFTVNLPNASTSAVVTITTCAQCIGGANGNAGGAWGSKYVFLCSNRAGVVAPSAIIIPAIYNYSSWLTADIPVWGTNTIAGTVTSVVLNQNAGDIVDYNFYYTIVFSA